MRTRRIFHRMALLLMGVVASCADSAGTSAADAAKPVDRREINDLAVDAGPLEDIRLDAPSDVRSDARFSDADVLVDRPPGVVIGGVFVPVDPSAVPPPGSECTSDASVRAGDPSIAPPRPLRPLSVSRVTSQRPTFQWALPEGTTGARVEVCADRCCIRVLQTIDAEGSTVRPTVALPPGVVFWRMFGRRGGDVGSRPSYTWEFGVRRRDAPGDTSWGTIRDFDGDGYDDVVMLRAEAPQRNLRSQLLLVRGGNEGLQAPTPTGIDFEHQLDLPGLGDFNGDGLADTLVAEIGQLPNSLFVIAGTSAGPGVRLDRTLEFLSLNSPGVCAKGVTSSLTDWNGDGFSDVIVSVSFECVTVRDPRPTILLGYYGSARGIQAVPQWAIRLDELFVFPSVINFGSLADIDTDGYGDTYLVSAHSGVGTTSLLPQQIIAHGSSGVPPRYELVPDPMLGDSAPGWAIGIPVSLGDIDGDGYGDWGMAGRAGVMYVYRHATGITRPAALLRDPQGAGYSALWTCPADMNGDGLADIVTSSPISSSEEEFGIPLDAGRVYVYFGNVGGTPGTPVWTDRAEHVPRDGHIYPLSEGIACGDFNADGFDDIVFGDDLGGRMCVRYGLTTFNTGHPDRCVDGIVAFGTWSGTWIY